MSSARARFTLLQRILHWTMAVMVITMLFIGIGMVSTLRPRFLVLISIHRPLGISILVLALVRLGVRLGRGVPPLPADLPRPQVAAAKASHVLLYVLLIVMPLIGWSMLSAGGYPIVFFGSIHLPPIMPHDDALYATLRGAHTALAYFLFATILAHISAALFHAWVRRDNVFPSMAPWFSGDPSGR